jgi:AraC-like DNA-binding protein
MVVPPHRRGGQAQYIETTVAVRAGAGDRLAATLEWAIQRLGQPLPVTALAVHCGLSARQFTRQFRQATGTTPHQWLLTQRLALAQRLLETTDETHRPHSRQRRIRHASRDEAAIAEGPGHQPGRLPPDLPGHVGCPDRFAGLVRRGVVTAADDCRNLESERFGEPRNLRGEGPTKTVTREC